MGSGAAHPTWQAWESPDKTISLQVGVESACCNNAAGTVWCHHLLVANELLRCRGRAWVFFIKVSLVQKKCSL